jgi:hypothetical protein
MGRPRCVCVHREPAATISSPPLLLTPGGGALSWTERRETLSRTFTSVPGWREPTG